MKDVNIIEQAAALIRDKFKIGLIITQCSIEAGPAYLSIDPKLKIELAVIKDHGGWIEHIDLEYSISGDDLKDGSLVDELIGGDLKKQAPGMRQTLRLAFILYDGIRYWTTGEQKKEYTDKGWSTRVVSGQSQSYVTE
ncbi:MAG: hypothetical protein SPK43_03545 [Candidatus Onthovivens sp.]|nr:hypothetical protein [Candidatus Onthovivens sp.]